MILDDFKKHIDKTLDELKLYAEMHCDRKLSGEFEFDWTSNKNNIITKKDAIINEIARKVFLNDNEIYPCVDLIIEDVTKKGIIIFKAQIAGFRPRPFQKGWSNRPGPFIYGINSHLIAKNIDTSSKEFIDALIDKGLLHYNPNNK